MDCLPFRGVFLPGEAPHPPQNKMAVLMTNKRRTYRNPCPKYRKALLSMLCWTHFVPEIPLLHTEVQQKHLEILVEHITASAAALLAQPLYWRHIGQLNSTIHTTGACFGCSSVAGRWINKCLMFIYHWVCCGTFFHIEVSSKHLAMMLCISSTGRLRIIHQPKVSSEQQHHSLYEGKGRVSHATCHMW